MFKLQTMLVAAALALPQLALAQSSGGVGVTPAGGVTRNDCVAKVPDGAVVTEDSDGSIVVAKDGVELQRVARCTPLDFQVTGSTEGSGWVAWSEQRAPADGPGWFKRIHSEWIVPPAPVSSENQQIYLFNSLTTEGLTDIIQPVLQWGRSPAGGGNYWSIASWWVVGTATGAVSELLNVSPGERVLGDIYAEDCDDAGVCTWTIITKTDSGETVLKTRTGDKVYTRAQPGVLEAYRVKSCRGFPLAPLTFTNSEQWTFDSAGERIDVTDASPWTGWTDQTWGVPFGLDCGYTIDITGHTTTVDYHD